MKIKVCGLRRPEDIVAARQLPIDFIGLIFYPDSPRFAASEELAEWMETHFEELENVRTVGVFVNAEMEEVLNAIHDYRLDYVQLHGNESSDYCRELDSFRRITSMRSAHIIKAFRVDEHFDFDTVAPFADWCRYVLFDTRGEQYGGTGKAFDWSLLQRYGGPLPFLLSGGIGEEDVPALHALKHPLLAGVDINSRFETAPGEKDMDKIARFVRALHNEEQ